MSQQLRSTRYQERTIAGVLTRERKKTSTMKREVSQWASLAGVHGARAISFKLRAKGQEPRARASRLLRPQVVFASNPQTLHFRLQRGSLQPKPVSCAGGTGE